MPFQKVQDLFDDLATAFIVVRIVEPMATPYVIQNYLKIQNYVCTYSLTSTAEIAAVKSLFGEIQNHAKLPVALPGVAERGSFVRPKQR
jgi:hypothetical protein